MSNNTLSNINKCGLKEITIFIISLIVGTAYTIYSKIVMDMLMKNNEGESMDFQNASFQAFGMFVGMLFGLIAHGVVLLFRIPFPGYDFNYTETRVKHSVLLRSESGDGDTSDAVGNIQAAKNNVAMKTFFYLIIPTILDWSSTLLCLMGLPYIDVSTYQLLRGSGIIFVALMKQHILKQHLYKFHWIGVFWNVISVVIVGSTAVLVSSLTSQGEGSGSKDNATTSKTLWGVWLQLAGTFIAAVQFVIEERMVKTNVPAPLLIGIEGLWGVLLSVLVIFLIQYYLLGDDQELNEDPFHTWSALVTSRNMQVAFIMYCCTSFFTNICVVSLMFVLSSVWRAIFDNFRSITVWVTSLVIFYCIDPSFGEMWTRYSYLQIVGLAILIYGTAIYNAPNHCSILLEGQWWALRIDLSAEYEAIRRDQMADVDAHFDYENLAEEYDLVADEEDAEVSGKILSEEDTKIVFYHIPWSEAVAVGREQSGGLRTLKRICQVGKS